MAKCTLYDAGIGVALIMRVPDKKQGIVCDELVSQVDLYPTLCSLLKLELEHEVDGVDFSNLFDQPNQAVREAVFAQVNFHTSYEPIRCIRTKTAKLIRYYDEEWRQLNLSNIDNSISKEAYLKQLEDSKKEMVQLYDLSKDPYEQHNLAGNEAYQSLLEEMDAKLLKWQQDFNDPLLKGPIALQAGWIVNKGSCIDPKSKNSCDFIQK